MPVCQMKVDRQIAAESRQQLRVNSVNSEIIGLKPIKFVHDVAGLLPSKLVEAASQSSNALSNVRANSKNRS